MAAFMAQKFLNSNATFGVRTLLPEVNGSIADIASWADVIRNTWTWTNVRGDIYNENSKFI